MKAIRNYSLSELNKEFKVGDYVLVSRWKDASMSDPWYISFIATIGQDWKGCFVTVKETGRRWENVKKITKKAADKRIALGELLEAPFKTNQQ